MKFKFIDLFAGMGGIRLGFEQACKELGIESECVLTSEIKPHAIETLNTNFSHGKFVGDIFNLKNKDIPKFDFLFGGFPCQPFSYGGKREGFSDTRGTLFFEIERILEHHKPIGFILENVEGLVKHDLASPNDEIGNTLKTILHTLENKLQYKVTWKVLDSIDFGVPQSRKRIFIVGLKNTKVSLESFDKKQSILNDIIEEGLDTLDTDFTQKLLSKYKISDLYGKSIKDKRGGKNNIHSWDIGLKGECSKTQINLLNQLFKERRKKHWAAQIGIDWMDGMPLTLEQIQTFFPNKTIFEEYSLKESLDDLVEKGYLRFEYPKKLETINTEHGSHTSRVYDETKPKGYNIVSGKLSFEINQILDPNKIAPTIVATDASKLAVVDGSGLRKLTIKEGLRLFGYPDLYRIPVDFDKAFDLLGNTVVVPVLKAISLKLLKAHKEEYNPKLKDEFHNSCSVLSL